MAVSNSSAGCFSSLAAESLSLSCLRAVLEGLGIIPPGVARLPSSSTPGCLQPLQPVEKRGARDGLTSEEDRKGGSVGPSAFPFPSVQSMSSALVLEPPGVVKADAASRCSCARLRTLRWAREPCLHPQKQLAGFVFELIGLAVCSTKGTKQQKSGSRQRSHFDFIWARFGCSRFWC